MAKFWGFHLMLDMSHCDNYAMRDYDTVYNFAKELVKNIDMVAYGEPQIVHFGKGDKAGFTLIQLIETSNICAHFANEEETIFLDVFSCKEFNDNVVIETVKKYFNPIVIRRNFITRQV
jgi:S-adenosylmethionine/arginine decarboxylase-like enzyme